VLPTVPSAFTQIATRASGFLDKVEALPLDELIAAATRLLRDADALLRVPGDGEVDEVTAKQLANAPLQQLAVTTTKTLAGVEALVASSEVERLPAKLAVSLDELDKTLRSTRRLLDGDTVESPLYFELSTALRELTNAATAVRILTESLEEKPNSVIFGR
jgi:paraquat-inducible protein B